MKKIRKISLVIMMAVLVGLLASCGSSSTDTIPAHDGKTLVVYFTHEGNTVFDGDLSDVDAITSATVQRDGDSFPPQVIDGVHVGNTQIIANDIAKYINADTFAIKVVDSEKYPIDGYETLDVAQNQFVSNARPQLATHIDNMDEYDVIYLGYPEWYSSMPMPVLTFLEEYDFTGKTIIPFSTHDGSGLGNSVSTIKSECPGAKVLDGLAIRYSDVTKASKKVEQWIDSMQK